MRIFWFSVILAVLAVAHRVLAKRTQNIIDDSDRTLIRVARSDLDEDEPRHNSKHVKKRRHHKRSAVETEHKRKRRAEVEDNFFQALLSRTVDVKQEKKRSFDDSADSKGSIIRDDWKGDSRISDVDRQELETLFSAINTEEEADQEKKEQTRSIKQGFDGKVESFIEWLLSQPPNRFTKSLSHILDVQTKLTKMFYGDKENQDQSEASNQNILQAADQSVQQLPFVQPAVSVQPQFTYSYPVQPELQPQPQPQPQSPVYYQQPQKLEPVQKWPVQHKCFGTLCAKSKGSKVKAPRVNDGAPNPAPAPQAPKAAPAPGPSTFDVPGANIQMSPITVTQGAPSMSSMDPYNPYQAQLPVATPYQAGFPPMKRKTIPQMPSDCEDYSQERCQIFMDWPTDKSNHIKASLRFKNNWSSDYEKPKSTKYKIFKAEVEKAIRKAYKGHKNFKDVKVTKMREEDMKTLVEFTLKFKKREVGALRVLQTALSSNYLFSMPVFKDTLLRDGLPHKHRNVVASQHEVDDIPDSKPTETEEDDEDTTELMSTHSTAYQGCFKDKKPDRDLPQRFSKFEMTPEWCIGRCKVANYKFAGLQYGYLCFCGNKFGAYGRAAENECSSKCFGDSRRKCGSFWHNSVYSVDGDAHSLSEFENTNDDSDDETDDNDKRNKIEEASGQEHTEVANHLMKAAEAALKAAKKLLPQNKKQKREPQDDLESQKAEAVAALGAAQTLMASNALDKEKGRHKREAERNTGKDLLVAYLSDVGGYDRKYRAVSDDDENGSAEHNVKFDYKRMVIDHSGDGEFVEKKLTKNIEARNRNRRSLQPQYPTDEDLYDGPKKMASRAVRDIEEPIRESNRDSGIQISMADENTDAPEGDENNSETEALPVPETEENPVQESEIPKPPKPESASPAVSEQLALESSKREVQVQAHSDAAETAGESGSASNFAATGDQAGESGHLGSSGSSRDERSVDKEDRGLTRRGRDVDEDDENELPQKRGKSKKKRQALLDEDEEEKLKKRVQKGVSKLKDLVMELYKQKSTIKAFQDTVEQLRKDIVKKLDVPEDQKEQVIKEIRSTMSNAAVEELKGMTGSIRQRLLEYAKDHPAVSIEAEEAGNSLKDIPLFEEESDEIKKKLKKRSVEIEQEIKKRSEGSEEIPDILKEHFKRNAPES